MAKLCTYMAMFHDVFQESWVVRGTLKLVQTPWGRISHRSDLRVSVDFHGVSAHARRVHFAAKAFSSWALRAARFT